MAVITRVTTFRVAFIIAIWLSYLGEKIFSALGTNRLAKAARNAITPRRLLTVRAISGRIFLLLIGWAPIRATRTLWGDGRAAIRATGTLWGDGRMGTDPSYRDAMGGWYETLFFCNGRFANNCGGQRPHADLPVVIISWETWCPV